MPTTTTSGSDDISVRDLIKGLVMFSQGLWRERALITRTILAASVVGLFFAFGSGEEYSAQARILPYRNGGSGGGGLSGLAGLAGIRLPVGSADQIITADLYPEVAKSQDFRIIVAETPLTFESLDKKVTAVEYFRDHRRAPLTELVSSYTIGLPRRLQSLLIPPNDNVSVRPKSADSSFLPRTYTGVYLDLVNNLSDRVTVSMDKKTSIITITAKMPDPYAAADLVSTVSHRLTERIIDYESRKAGEQFTFVSEQFKQAKSRYEKAQRDLAIFSDRNRALMSATSQIDRDRLQRENDLAFEVYQQFSRELEQARIKMKQDTPAFTVLDQVAVPVNRASPRRLQTLLLSLCVGLLVGVGQIGIRRLALFIPEN